MHSVGVPDKLKRTGTVWLLLSEGNSITFNCWMGFFENVFWASCKDTLNTFLPVLSRFSLTSQINRTPSVVPTRSLCSPIEQMIGGRMYRRQKKKLEWNSEDGDTNCSYVVRYCSWQSTISSNQIVSNKQTHFSVVIISSYNRTNPENRSNQQVYLPHTSMASIFKGSFSMT